MKTARSSIFLTFATTMTTSAWARECFQHEIVRYGDEVKIQLDNVDIDNRKDCESEMQAAGITLENKQSGEKNAAYCALTSCEKVDQYIVDKADEWASLPLWPKCTLNGLTLVEAVKKSNNVCQLESSTSQTTAPDDGKTDIGDSNLKGRNKSGANTLGSTFTTLAVLTTCFALLI